MPEQAAIQQHWRLFVAIELPEEVRAALARTQAELQERVAEGCISWANPEQFHLTLKFLGNVLVEQVEPMSQALQDICASYRSLRLRAQGLGAFPNLRFPRIIWAGLNDRQGQLQSIQKAVEFACAEFTSEPAEDKFTGHVTLGRAKRLQRREAMLVSKCLGGMLERSFGEWAANAFDLMRSQLSPKGATHILVRRFSWGPSHHE